MESFEVGILAQELAECRPVVFFGQGGLEIGCGEMNWALLVSTPLHSPYMASFVAVRAKVEASKYKVNPVSIFERSISTSEKLKYGRVEIAPEPQPLPPRDVRGCSIAFLHGLHSFASSAAAHRSSTPTVGDT